jgi:hypothetical protein
MGKEARQNLLSRQYEGELPANMIGGNLIPRVGISQEWLDAHPVVEGQPPEPVPEDQQMIEWRMTGVLVIPSALVDRSRWPNYQIDMGVVKEMRLDEFKKLAMTPRP